MSRNQGWFVLIALAMIGFLGCGKSDGPAGQSTPPQTTGTSAKPTEKAKAALTSLEAPAAACFEFLEAVRTGNDTKAAQMLSTTARAKVDAMNLGVTPPASDTAKFTLGKVEHIGEDGARVESIWTEVDEDGQPQSDKAIWVLRQEQDGWKIVGVAAIIFENEPPLLLNFEDPEDMLKKQQWVREEIRHRMEKDNLQAKEPDNSENSMRR
jgi:hypothetical protein